MKREGVIVSGVWIASASFGGSLRDISPTELGAQVVREALSRAAVGGADAGHVVFGSVIHYAWRRCETRLNALPQFVTGIDGLDIHLCHCDGP